MTDTEILTQLGALNNKLKRLLDDPEPGVFHWKMAVSDVWRDMGLLWTSVNVAKTEVQEVPPMDMHASIRFRVLMRLCAIAEARNDSKMCRIIGKLQAEYGMYRYGNLLDLTSHTSD